MLKATKVKDGYSVRNTNYISFHSYSDLLKYIKKNNLVIKHKIEDDRGNVISLIAE